MKPSPGLPFPVFEHHVRGLGGQHQQVFGAAIVPVAVPVVNDFAWREGATHLPGGLLPVNVLHTSSFGIDAAWIPAPRVLEQTVLQDVNVQEKRPQTGPPCSQERREASRKSFHG